MASALTSLRTAIRATLLADAILPGLLASSGLIVLHRRKGHAEFPVVVYYDVGSYPYLAQSGQMVLRDSIFTFDVFAKDDERAEEICTRIKLALHNQPITVSDGLARVASCRLMADRVGEFEAGDIVQRGLDFRVLAYLDKAA